MLNVKEWAEDNLPEDNSDDVPLTEEERNLANALLESSALVDEEPTRVVRLTDTSIEYLQHGMMLVRAVLKHRYEWFMDHDDDEYTDTRMVELMDSIKNSENLYNWLETAKNQEAI